MNLTFIHSGNLGDIIYSIPFCLSLAKHRNIKKFDYIFHINQPASYDRSIMIGNHPFGNKQLTLNGSELLKPLLKQQHYINNIYITSENINIIKQKFNNTEIVDLNIFRQLPLNFSGGIIPKWYYPICTEIKEYFDINNRWIFLNKNKNYFDKFRDKIIIFRSLRYFNNNISYTFLKQYKDNLIFLGVESEYDYFKSQVCECEYIKVKDFLEATSIINNCKFVIGNQTFLFSLAEALKVPRVLEQCQKCPNVITLGGISHDVIYQKQFEDIVRLLFNINN